MEKNNRKRYKEYLKEGEEIKQFWRKSGRGYAIASFVLALLVVSLLLYCKLK